MGTKMRWKVALILLLPTIAACSNENAGGVSTHEIPAYFASMEPCPLLTTQSASGSHYNSLYCMDPSQRPVNLKGINSDQKLLVNVWASWCRPCRDEMPHLSSFAEQHKGQIQVMGVLTQDTISNGNFLLNVGARYPSAFDSDGKFLANLGLPSLLPTTILLGGDGEVIDVHYRSFKNASEVADFAFKPRI